MSKDEIARILKNGGRISHHVNCYRLTDVDGFKQKCTITHATIVALLDNLYCLPVTKSTNGELYRYTWREHEDEN